MKNGFFRNPIVIVVLIVIVVAFVAYQQFTKGKTLPTTSQISSVAPVKAKAVVNRTFQFAIPASDPKARIEEKVSFTILSAERKDEIKVKGQARKPSAGHDFMLIRIELDNPSTRRIKFASADFIRLLGPSDKKYSPDFHNGGIVLDPISVRRDLVSFMVDKDARQFSFLVGELDKDKERIEIEFK